MYYIGVISDTHGLLRLEILEHLKHCDVILHGGDINRKDILDELESIAPVYAVRGNNDKEWAEYLPDTLSLKIYGKAVFMVHKKKHIPASMNQADIIIYGHSHKYEERWENAQLYLNPGSCGPRRFSQPVTMAVIEIGEDGSCAVQKIDLSGGNSDGKNANGANGMKENSADMKKIIRAVMSDMNRNKPVGEIARKNHISAELAEQICRLYVTHPGVDEDGIMTKMGL